MHMRLLTLTLLLLPLAACRVRHTPVLAPANLYQTDSVKKAMAFMDDDPVDPGPSVGIDSLKKLICWEPWVGGYFQLGCLLLDSGRYLEGTKALRVAEQLRYGPAYDVQAQLARAYAGTACCDWRDSSDHFDLTYLEYESLAFQCMRTAIRNGYPHPEHFLRDTAFWGLSHAEGFYPAYFSALARKGDPSLLRWADFEGGFPTLSLPFRLDTAALEKPAFSYYNRIEPDFEDFIPAIGARRFSRVVDENFYAVGRMGGDTSYTALLYADVLFEPGSQAHDLAFSGVYYLATYDSRGKPIDKMAVGGHMMWKEPVKVFSLEPSMAFTVAVAGHARHYRIGGDGHFLEDIPRAMGGL